MCAKKMFIEIHTLLMKLKTNNTEKIRTYVLG